MRLSKQECWVTAWAKVGVKSSGNISAEIAERRCQVNGAEHDAVAYLLGEAERYCVLGHVDGAAERLKLAAAMVEQRGRVLGALRAAKAVEEAFWPVDLDGNGRIDRSWDAVDAAVRLAQLREAAVAMVENGFGPQPEGAK